MKLRGNDLVMFFKVGDVWKTMAYATTCELDINASTIKAASDANGKYQRHIVKNFDWKCSTAHLLASGVQQYSLLEKMKEGAPVRLAIASIEKTDESRDFMRMFPDGKLGVQGDAMVQRLTVSGNVTGYANLFASFIGAGELLGL